MTRRLLVLLAVFVVGYRSGRLLGELALVLDSESWR